MPSREIVDTQSTIVDRRPTMVICPVCGYDPHPPAVELSFKELWQKRLRNIFTVNSMQPWWLDQTVHVCEWLKGCGIAPEYILDFGCGDGRWIYGIGSVFPKAKYTGIDRLEDHYLLNKERFPEVEWIYGDFCDYTPAQSPDMIFLMGTLNPALPETERKRLFDAIVSIKPRNMVCLFDYNSTGRPAGEDIKAVYKNVNTLVVPAECKGMKQSIAVDLYELK